MKWTPHPYQMQAAPFMLERDAAGLLLAPGLGKTSTTLAVIRALQATKQIKAALVIAPLRPMQATWPAEVAKWDEFKLMRVRILHGPKKAERLAEPADVYVINPEGLDWLFQAQHGELPFDALVVDESTKFKNHASSRFKLLKSQLRRFKRRYILSGTPSPNGIEDLWAQLYLLDGGERLGAYITHFRRAYMIDVAPKRAEYAIWRPVLGAEEVIRDKVADICMALRAEDYLTMPELIVNDITVDLPKPAAKQYRELRDQFITMMAGGVVTAANAAAKTTKLRQMANGIVYDDTSAYHPVHEAKLDALAELVAEQAGDPLLIAVAFLSEVAAIRDALKDLTLPYLGGGVTTSQAAKIVADWNAGKLPVLLAHPTSVAHGLNLQAGGRAVCWFGLTYNREEYDQLNARVYRQGQTRGVVIHRILANGTIDAAIVDALGSKGTSQRAFIDSLRRLL
jgi:SNF2 family DNA or RNA helicase